MNLFDLYIQKNTHKSSLPPPSLAQLPKIKVVFRIWDLVVFLPRPILLQICIKIYHLVFGYFYGLYFATEQFVVLAALVVD